MAAGLTDWKDILVLGIYFVFVLAVGIWVSSYGPFCLTRFWYLTHMLAVYARSSLRVRAVSTEPKLVAYIKFDSR